MAQRTATRPSRPTAALVSLALLAGACSSGAPDTAAPGPTATPAPAATTEPAPDPSPAPTVTPSSEPEPDPTPQPQPLRWEPCGALECATVTVPLDHDDPTGPSLDVAIARAATADPDLRIGSLLVNPGGPGASGVEFLDGFAQRLPLEITARFDIVSWDPRGVGATAGLDCGVATAAQINETITVDDGIDDDIERITEATADLGSGCLAAASDILAHVGTVAVARDLDLIRASLGDDQLTYLGFSYGTRIGAVYATLFPTAVRAMILDGAFPPGLTSRDLAESSADLQATLERIDRVCALEVDCGVADEGVIGAYQRLLTELDPEPNGDDLGLSDRSLLLGATLLAIYAPNAWQTYTVALGQALDGDIELLTTMAELWFTDDSGDFSDVYKGSNVAIMCGDGAYPSDEPDVLADAEAALVAAPLLADIVLGANCTGWPVAAEPLPPINTAGSPQLLVIGTTNDPATPLRWAELMAEGLDDAALITHVGDGHTVVGGGNACVEATASAYLAEPESPLADQTCRDPDGVLGIQVELAEGGYVVLEVLAGTAAADAGLRVGDIITAVDGLPAVGPEVFVTSPGQLIEIDVLRDGEVSMVEVEAGRRPWTLGP